MDQAGALLLAGGAWVGTGVALYLDRPYIAAFLALTAIMAIIVSVGLACMNWLADEIRQRR